MFIDKEWKKEKKLKNIESSEPEPRDHNKPIILIFIGFVVFLLIVIVGVFWAVKTFPGSSPFNGSTPTTTPDQDDEEEDYSFSHDEENLLEGSEERVDQEISTSTELIKAEMLNFGDFYEQIEYDYDEVDPDQGYELPIDSKVEVSNFYDIDRKIDLEAEEEDLNLHGFSIIDNPFSEDTDNFYSMYRKLYEEQIPVLVTKDFLNYYYQNVLKNNYKTIEGNIFYENLWHIASSLYERSRLRYESLLESEGMSNDPYVQGARMEVAYFATALELLRPREDQISESRLEGDSKFSRSEADRFFVDLPQYLQDDVPQEVELILEASEDDVRSPVLLYRTDYTRFDIPQQYQESSRLENVYLAFRWLNSLFPIYFEEESCPDCKLDRADWRIVNLASIFIAHDFNQEQDLKNDWAQVYKLVSFFDGLRDEFTYIHYARKLQDLLGEGYNLKDSFFDKDLSDLDDKLLDFRQKLVSDFDFTQMEGAHDHTATSSRPYIGFRTLSQPYIPNEYIYEELVYPKVGEFSGTDSQADNRDLRTACDIDRVPHRCLSSGWDVPNLIYPVPEDFDYFSLNTLYENYDPQVEMLRSQLEIFGEYAWLASNYWNTSYIYKQALENINPHNPMLSRPQWAVRNLESFVGSLLNTELGADKLEVYEGRYHGNGFQLEEIPLSEEYTYIEPNLALVREMESSLAMIRGMMNDLGIFEKVASVDSELQRAKNNFKTLGDILERQFNSDRMEPDDINFIKDMTTRYKVAEERDKELTLDDSLEKSIQGVKLLLLVYERDGRKVMGAGPVFNYQEDSRRIIRGR